MAELTPTSGAAVPVFCTVARPDSKTVRFAGVPIHLGRVSRRCTPPMSPVSISRFLAGRRPLRTDQAETLAKALGMRVDYFIREVHRIQSSQK